VNAALDLAAGLEAGSAVSVVLAGGQDRARWNAYVDSHPEGSFFHRHEWMDVLSQAVGFSPHYLLALRAGTVVGLLPLARIESRLFGRYLCSLPFCVEAGVLASDPVAEEKLISAAKAEAEAQQVACLELRHARRHTDDLPCKDSLYVNFRKPLLPTVEENLQAIPRKQRAVVRKGIAAGLVGRDEAGLEHFFRIYATSVRNLGTPVFPRRYFAALLEAFGSDLRITTVFAGDTPVASVMSFLHKGTVMPYYGGGLPAARDCKAYDFMYWEVMRTACEAGLQAFDYGRSKVGTGAFAFKKNWGFEPRPLHYEYHLVSAREMPDRNPANPRYSLAIEAWKKLPLPVANLLGAWVSPYLA
jgi:FemAB-related protein (PEP-CTERM system-associated)